MNTHTNKLVYSKPVLTNLSAAKTQGKTTSANEMDLEGMGNAS
jgi:hypothetical protein